MLQPHSTPVRTAQPMPTYHRLGSGSGVVVVVVVLVESMALKCQGTERGHLQTPKP